MDIRIFINEDNDHYFKQTTYPMTEPGLRDYVDGYADGGIDTISFCVNGQRASFRSNVLDAIWDPLPEGITCRKASWADNAKSLHDAGIDPYAVWIDQCHRRGLQAWISFRMNDNHHAAPFLQFRADRRWFQNPKWRRGPNCDTILPDQPWDYYLALQPVVSWNYALEPVRTLMMAFFRENVDHYDADAFELDFNRDIFCLTPGHEREEAHFLTDFVRECRRVLQEKAPAGGAPKKLVVRVPWHPDAAAAWGFDVRQWCREKLVDAIIASPYWRSFQYEFPSDAWRTLAGGIPVYPAIDQWLAPAPDLPEENITAEALKGWADNMAALGLPGVYLFNFPYFPQPGILAAEEAEKFRSLLARGLSLKTFRETPRRYQMGYQDVVSPEDSGHSPLPATLSPGHHACFELPVGELPEDGQVTVTPRFAEPAPHGAAHILLNGFQPDAEGVFTPAMLRRGSNRIEIANAGGADFTLTNLYLDIRQADESPRQE